MNETELRVINWAIPQLMWVEGIIRRVDSAVSYRHAK